MNSCLTNDQIISLLREQGVTPTAHRIAICKYVLCEKNHSTAEEVKKWLDANFPTVSLATVYNTLNTLVAVGLLKEIRVPNSEKVLYDNNQTPHYHFFDEETGMISDLCPEEIQVTLGNSQQYTINTIEVMVRGIKRS